MSLPAPDAYFLVGTAGPGPVQVIAAGEGEASTWILSPAGDQYTYSDQAAPVLARAVNQEVTLTLPDTIKVGHQ